MQQVAPTSPSTEQQQQQQGKSKGMKIEHRNVPFAAIQILLNQLQSFGTTIKVVSFTHNECSGQIFSIAGVMKFNWDGDLLVVEVVSDPGHFTPNMVIGGVRQMIEEAIEQTRMQRVAEA